MDGTLAVVFAIVGLADMNFNHCETGCLARHADQARIWFQVGETHVDGAGIEVYRDAELTVGYDFDRRFGPFQPMMSVSTTEGDDVWLGAGFKWRMTPEWSDFFVEGSFQPGLYVNDEGPDIGGNIHFRSALGLGYEFNNGSSLLVSYDHRSNGDIRNLNPGKEVLSVQYSIALD